MRDNSDQVHLLKVPQDFLLNQAYQEVNKLAR